MLTEDDALNLNYYKKATFTGWMGGMRFLIRREEPEEGEPIFHAWVWPGPYIFDLVDDSRKLDFTAPFTDEGKRQAVDWINGQHEKQGWENDWKGRP
ncbi:MAG: GNAT family acetyltransferase [Clostridiales bacterium]|nr:GNAT family acetyltransferase [Clostridiales bacterium]